jgi:hypothetical protein
MADEPTLCMVTGSFTICSACLDGKGGECHTPGCILWINRCPDLAIRGMLNAHGCRIKPVVKYVAPCTGIAAVWCPNHGDCNCPEEENGERCLDFPACPLHNANSDHAENADDA